MAKKTGPFTFAVEGTYPFPADMLRYDACWPARSEDAVQMSEAMRHDLRKKLISTRSIHLMTMKESAPTTGRWESFGWKVV